MPLPVVSQTDKIPARLQFLSNTTASSIYLKHPLPLSYTTNRSYTFVKTPNKLVHDVKKNQIFRFRWFLSHTLTHDMLFLPSIGTGTAVTGLSTQITGLSGCCRLSLGLSSNSSDCFLELFFFLCLPILWHCTYLFFYYE